MTMLEICSSAPMLAKAAVAVHNNLEHKCFRRKLALIPFGVALCLWLGFYFCSTRINAEYERQHRLATALMSVFDTSGRAIVVVSEDGKVLGGSKASESLLGVNRPGSNILDDIPQLKVPIETAIGAAETKTNKSGLTQFVTKSIGSQAGDMQVNVTAAKVKDEYVIVVTAWPSCDLDAKFVDGEHPGTVYREVGP